MGHPDRSIVRRRAIRVSSLLGLALLMLSIASPASAGGNPKDWAAPVDGNWNVPANWNPVGVPTAQDDVFITVQGNYTVTIDTDAATAASLRVGTSSPPVGTGPTLWQKGQILSVGGPITIDVGGTYLLDLGTLSTSAPVNVAGKFKSAATVSGMITVGPGGVFTWEGGTWGDPFSLTNNPGGTVEITGIVTVPASGSGTFTNSGAVSMQPSGYFAAAVGTPPTTTALTIANGGTWSCPSGTVGFGSSTLFTSTGAVTVESGTLELAGASEITGGTVNVASGATLQLNSNTPLTTHSAMLGPVALTGHVVVAPGTTAIANGLKLMTGAQLDNNGTLALEGDVWISFVIGATAKRAVVLTYPDIVLDNGGLLDLRGDFGFRNMSVGPSSIVGTNSFRAASAGAFLLNNTGLMKKSTGTTSTIEAVPSLLTNSGTLSIDSGWIDVYGGFVQTPDGTLAVTIAGPATGMPVAGIDYTQLRTRGPTTTLDGKLDVSLMGGFIPAEGSTYEPVTFLSLPSGNFASKSDLSYTGGALRYALNATNVTLTATPNTVTVTSNADVGTGTLREAIERANAGTCSQPCTISFASGMVITIASALPAITAEGVTIDGTQVGGTTAPVVQILGTNMTDNILTLTGPSSVIRGLSIGGSTGNAITISGSLARVEGCYIGLAPDGVTATPNGYAGIEIQGASNIIGGAAAQRNVISANSYGVKLDIGADSNQVIGNYIGTNAAGSAVVLNTDRLAAAFSNDYGVKVVAGAWNTIVDGNLISGNASGFYLESSTMSGRTEAPHAARAVALRRHPSTMIVQPGNRITNNLIGTDATGTAAIGNGIGVQINGLADATEIGPGNIIAGNTQGGIHLIGGGVGGTKIIGNFIGTNSGGTLPLPNEAYGVSLETGVFSTTIGGAAEGNVIAFNNGPGIRFGVAPDYSSGNGNAILQNSIYDNTGLGIDLAGTNSVLANDVDSLGVGDVDTGSNGLQNMPVLASAMLSGANLTVSTSVNSSAVSATQAIRVEFFAADTDGTEGKTFLDAPDSQCVAGNNLIDFPVTVSRGPATAGSRIVATATSYTDSACTTVGDGTSNFSAAVGVICGPMSATISGTPTYCAGGTTTLTANASGGSGSYTYAWQKDGVSLGATSSALAVGAAGSYTVVVTDGACSVTSGGMTVAPSTLAATISGTPTYCAGGTTTLTANASGGSGSYTYTWQKGGVSVGATASSTLAVGAEGSYTVVVADGTCSVTSGGTTVAASTLAAMISGAPTYCAGGSTTLTANASGGTGSYTYAWQKDGVSLGATSSTLAVSAAGSYTVVVSDGTCSVTSGGTTVAASTLAAMISGPATYCAGGSTTLTANASGGTGSYTYAWKKDGVSLGAASSTLAVSAAGSYTVVVSDGTCSVTSGGTTVAASTLAAMISGAPTYCVGGSTTLTANASGGTGSYTYVWQKDGVSLGAAGSTLAVGAAGSYTVVVSDGTCSVTSGGTTVAPSTLAATISGPTSVCAGGSATLTASGGTSYAWSSGETTATIIVSPTATTTYTVTVTNSGCSATASQGVTVNTPATPTVSASATSFCPGGSVTLTASTASSYQWLSSGTPISGATGVTYVATAAGSYSVTTTDINSCPATSASIAITATPAPSAAISGPTSVCPGGSATLTASGGTSYSWSTGETTATITVSPTTTTTYTVTVTNNGCSATASHAVTVNALPTPMIAGTAAICAGQSTTLDAGTGYMTYLWSTGATTQTITVSPTATTPYSVTVRNSVGCSASASQTVTVNALPTAPVITGMAAICAGQSTTLDAGTGYMTYLWSTGATTQTITVSPTTTTTYSVTVANTAGCTASASKTVTVSAAIRPVITAPQAVCASSTANAASVPAETGATYLWTITGGAITSGLNTNAVTFRAAETGDVLLAVQVSSGICSGTASVTIPITSPPTVQISGPASVCSGSEVTLDAGAGYASYLWSTGATTRTITFAATTAISVVVTVSNALGCPATASHSVAITPAPNATITAPSSIVAGSTSATASVPAGEGGTTYSWLITGGTITSGTGTSSITFAPEGSASVTLTVTVTSAAGCTARGGATIDVTPPLCNGVAAQLIAPADNATGLTSPVTFSWSAASGASYYELWVLIDGSSAQLAATSSSTSVTIPVNGTAVSWYVGTRFDGCSTLLSPRRTLSLTSTSPCDGHGAPTALTPEANASTTSPVTFTWTAVTNSSAYRIWISIDGAPLQDIGTTTSGSVTTLTLDVAPGAISWLVEALFTGCPSTRSAAMAFTIPKPDPCAGHAAAELTSPANGATSTSSVDFHWGSVTGASGYRVWASVEGAAPAVYGITTFDTTVRSSIASGHVEWYVEALFDGCPSVESLHRTFEIPKAAECGAAVAALVEPAESAALSSPTVTFRWSEVPKATGYEVLLSLNQGTPVLLGTATTTSLTREVAPGALEWFVRTTFDGCPALDSSHGVFTYTPPPACSDERPLPTSPVNNAANVHSPVNFSWKKIEGATSYKVWISINGARPAVLDATTATRLENANLPAGTIEWWVEATTTVGCPTVSSTANRLTVVPPPPPCTTPDQPVIIAQTTVSSGVPLTIRWQGIARGMSSIVQESQSGDFSGASSVTVDGDEHEFTHLNSTNAPQTWYFRIRGVNSCAQSEPLVGPYSLPLAVIVLPEKPPPASDQLTGSLPADTATTSVTYTITLDAALAGLSFTAVPNQSWLTVTPSSGVIPAGGIELKVTATTTGLSIGTTLGGVTINTFAASGSGRAAPRGTTSTTSTVSVSLVQPVLPTPKNTPPPDALIIPAVAHADGVNSSFESDVRVTNTSAQVMKYQLTFTPSGDEGIKTGRQTSIDVEPGRTVALDDVLGTWFASGAFNSLVGTLEVRPLTQSAASTSGAANTGLQNLVTFASSRTFASSALGSYGQYVPAIPFANFIGKGASVLSLQQISQSASYRTNLGLVEGSGAAATALVSVFGSSGVKMTEFPVSLTGGQHVQLNSFLAAKNVELSDGRVEVRVTSPGGKVTAYASVLDNQTNDPLLVTPMAIGQGGATKYVLPGVADLSSGLAQWRTDMRVFNASPKSMAATFTFYSQNKGEAPRTAEVSFAPNEVKQFDAVVSQLFGALNNGGALHIATASTSNLIATGRTYNQTAGGTYGQFVGAVTLAEGAALGTRPLQILQVEESSRFRSNVGVAEIAGKPARIQLAVIPPDARTTTLIEVNLAANEFRQLTSLLREIGLKDSYNVRVSVKVVGGDGRVTAYASVIDAMTQDPTYIPAQ